MSFVKGYTWSAIMLVYSGLFTYLSITGRLGEYVHPRFHLAIYLSIFALLILIVEDINYTRVQPLNHKWKTGWLLFILPLLLVMVKTDSKDTANLASSNGGLIHEAQVVQDTQETQVVSVENSSSKQHLSMEESASLHIVNEDIGQELLKSDYNTPYKVEDKYYLDVIEQLHIHTKALEGKKIKYTGMVYKQEDFGENEMVVGRMLMYCCAADMQVTGILTNWDAAADFEPGDWVEVLGHLSSKEYAVPGSETGMTIPYLILEEVHLTNLPDEPYVYY